MHGGASWAWPYDRLGVLIGRGAVVGDVIEPAVAPEEWENAGP